MYTPLGAIESWYAFEICLLIRNRAVNRVLALVAIGRLIELNWKASENQEWFPYNYNKGMVTVW